MGNIEFKNGTFKGEEELKYLAVCKPWKPTLFQRFLYWTGLKKDPNTTIKVSELAGGWIKVKDRLPEESGRYLHAELGDDETTEVYYNKERNSFSWMARFETPNPEDYWMPLPKPPTK